MFKLTILMVSAIFVAAICSASAQGQADLNNLIELRVNKSSYFLLLLNFYELSLFVQEDLDKPKHGLMNFRTQGYI